MRTALVLFGVAAVAAAICYGFGFHVEPRDRSHELDMLDGEITEVETRTAALAAYVDSVGRQTVRRRSPLSYAANGGKGWDR